MKKELMEKRLEELKNADKLYMSKNLSEKGLGVLKVYTAFTVLCVYGLLIKDMRVPYKILRMTSVSKYR